MNEIKFKGDLKEFEFARKIRDESGEIVNICYQCKKCASGCPVVNEMDYTPSQIIHAIRLGLKDLVLNSKTIWLCASCETCTTRCPQELDIAKIMDSARIIAIRERVKPKVPQVKAFYKSMLQNIRMFGRVYELGMIGLLKLKTKEFTKDMELGMKMLKKGKLKILPEFKNLWNINKIFRRANKLK